MKYEKLNSPGVLLEFNDGGTSSIFVISGLMFLGGSGIGRLSSTLRSSFSHAGLAELPFGNLQVKTR